MGCQQRGGEAPTPLDAPRPLAQSVRDAPAWNQAARVQIPPRLVSRALRAKS